MTLFIKQPIFLNILLLILANKIKLQNKIISLIFKIVFFVVRGPEISEIKSVFRSKVNFNRNKILLWV